MSKLPAVAIHRLRDGSFSSTSTRRCILFRCRLYCPRTLSDLDRASCAPGPQACSVLCNIRSCRSGAWRGALPRGHIALLRICPYRLREAGLEVVEFAGVGLQLAPQHLVRNMSDAESMSCSVA